MLSNNTNNKNMLEKQKDILGEEMLQYLVFKIDSEEYAIDVLSVQEIVGFTNITPVPGSPNYMVGLINLRGNILHVVDLRLRLGVIRDKEHSFDKDVIIVVSNSERRFGFLVDMVKDVINVVKEQVSETPVERTKGVQISHVINLNNKVIMVLPVDEVIKSEQELSKDTSTII